MVIKGYRVGPLLRKVGREIGDDNVPGMAAQTAFYFFSSIFPLFLFIAPLLSLVGDRNAMMNWIVGQLERVVPADALAVVQNVVRDVVFAPGAPGLMSIGLLGAAWAGSNVFGALMDSLNRAYDVTEGRPWWKKKLIALGAVASAGVFLALASVIMLAGPEIAQWLASNIGLGQAFLTAWAILRLPIAFALLVAMLWMIYSFLPNLRQSHKQVIVGALAAATLLIVATLLFRLYVANFGSYNKTYGTIGGIIVLLTWMYLTMLAILIGGELNAELHHGTGAIDPRSGAVYAGRIVTASEPGRASTDRIERLRPVSS